MRLHVGRPGFRTRVLVIATTLLNHKIYTKSDFSTLYQQRWHAELDLRSIKIVLGLDMLRCHKPQMVRKELWMTLLGYNVILALMAQAGATHGSDPRHLSFKGALQTLVEFAPGLREGTPEQRQWLRTILLSSIARDAVGDRPDRVDPRARKRRPKQYHLLTKPWRQAKDVLLKTGQGYRKCDSGQAPFRASRLGPFSIKIDPNLPKVYDPWGWRLGLKQVQRYRPRAIIPRLPVVLLKTISKLARDTNHDRVSLSNHAERVCSSPVSSHPAQTLD